MYLEAAFSTLTIFQLSHWGTLLLLIEAMALLLWWIFPSKQFATLLVLHISSILRSWLNIASGGASVEIHRLTSTLALLIMVRTAGDFVFNRKMMQVALVSVYFISGLRKITSEDFLSGEALYTFLSTENLNLLFPELFRTFALENPEILKATSLGVCGFLMLVPVFYFLPFKWSRIFIVTGLILFHLFTVVVMDLVIFGVVMLILVTGLLTDFNFDRKFIRASNL